jgi:predicted MFS family arabinose efflux permease
VLFERLGWRATFFAMSGIVLVASAPIALATEPPRAARLSLSAAGKSVHFLLRPGAWRILLVVLSYKVPEALAAAMLRPYLSDAGLGLADVGWMLGTVGFLAGLVGALTGGALVNRIGQRKALLVFGALQTVAVLGYAFAALARAGRGGLTALSAFEHFASGTATASLFTAMMDFCRPESNATDYTVQASAVVIATGLGASASGFTAHALGYAGHFGLCAALGVVSLAPVFLFFPKAQSMCR